MSRSRRSNSRPVAVLALLAAVIGAPRLVSAQTPDELRAARELFQEALKDEQEKRYDVALEKFRRVARVRESPSVRYRIATLLAATGKLREARDLFRALAASKASLSANDQETADSAAERAAELDRRIPRLALRVESDPPPPDLRVSVDGTPVPVSATPRSIELDPGDHVVLASASGRKQFQGTVTLEEGAPEVSHTVSLVPEATVAEPTGPARKRDPVPWILVGGGGALVVAGVVLLAAREGAVSDIKGTCPLNRCPTATKHDVESDRSRAELFGPLGATLGIAGLVAAGVGVYLLVRPQKPSATGTYLVLPSARGVVVRF